MIFFFKFPLVPSFGGAEFHTLSLALEMRTRGQQTMLVTSDPYLFRLFIKHEVQDNNIEVVNPSLSVIARSEAPRKSQFTIGILGLLDPEKGVFCFLTSVIPHLPDAKVIIAGDGFEKKLIEQFIDENNLRSQIKLIGFIYDLGQFFFQISALVYPTKVPESYGIAAAEA